jgi:hypothetical protein
MATKKTKTKPEKLGINSRLKKFEQDIATVE